MPEVEGVLRRTLATSFLAIGDLEEAGNHAEQSLKLLEATEGEEQELILQALQLLASVRAAEGKPEESKSLLGRIAALTGEAAPETPIALIGMESTLTRGDLDREAGKILEAMKSYLSIASSEEIPPEIRVRVASGIALCSEHLAPRATALQCHDVAVSFAKQNLGDKHPLTLEAIRMQAVTFLAACRSRATTTSSASVRWRRVSRKLRWKAWERIIHRRCGAASILR